MNENRTGAEIADELVAHVVNSGAEGFFMPVEAKVEGLMDGESLFVTVSRHDLEKERDSLRAQLALAREALTKIAHSGSELDATWEMRTAEAALAQIGKPKQQP